MNRDDSEDRRSVHRTPEGHLHQHLDDSPPTQTEHTNN